MRTFTVVYRFVYAVACRCIHLRNGSACVSIPLNRPHCLNYSIKGLCCLVVAAELQRNFEEISVCECSCHHAVISELQAARRYYPYSTRRNSVISQVKTKHNMCIRSWWANRLVFWVEHPHRQKATWAYQLLVTQDDEWLRIMCLLAGSPSYEAGGTGTRVGRGFPVRWGAGWLEPVSLNGGGRRILSGTNNELLQESP